MAVTKIFASVYILHVLHFSFFPLQRGDFPERPMLFNGHHSVRRMPLSNNVYVIFIHFVLSLSAGAAPPATAPASPAQSARTAGAWSRETARQGT